MTEITSPAILLRAATKKFATPAGSAFTALKDVDLEVAAGEFVSIVGPTGCGKSTALSLISGLEQATSGTIEVNGKPVTGIPDGVGYMFQTDAVLPWKNVLDNVGGEIVFLLETRSGDPHCDATIPDARTEHRDTRFIRGGQHPIFRGNLCQFPAKQMQKLAR